MTSKSLPLALVALLAVSCVRQPPAPRSGARPAPDRDEAIKQAFELLLRRGFEGGNAYDHATYLPVHFRDGGEGVFIAIGFSGPVRGYSMLFNVRNGSLELLEVRQDKVDWGIWSTGIRGQPHNREVDAELTELTSITFTAPKSSSNSSDASMGTSPRTWTVTSNCCG